MEITVRNVNHALSEAFWRLKALDLKPEPTRNGPALVFPEPVITTYLNPQERVLFFAGRDANPIFHLMESIWILAGKRDVAFLQQFNSKIGQFSDDGRRFNAAYGYRIRKHFGHDQLVEVVELLRRDPDTRQAVIQIWDEADLTKRTLDKACNLNILFDTRGGRLNMTVFNRSNDLWWGAYGANAVHFSILQELIACAIERPMGVYRQVSANMHLYTELYDAAKYIDTPPPVESYDLYSSGAAKPLPLMIGRDYKRFLLECARFCADPFNEKVKYANSFLTHVAHPMAMVSRARKTNTGDGADHAAKIQAEDWRAATLDWVERRNSK